MANKKKIDIENEDKPKDIGKHEENKSEIKKELVKVKEAEKLTLIEQQERRQKKNTFIIINIVIIAILFGIFSTIFAFFLYLFML